MAIKMKRVVVELILDLTNPEEASVYQGLKPCFLQQPGLQNRSLGEVMRKALVAYFNQEKGLHEDKVSLGDEPVMKGS